MFTLKYNGIDPGVVIVYLYEQAKVELSRFCGTSEIISACKFLQVFVSLVSCNFCCLQVTFGEMWCWTAGIVVCSLENLERTRA
jgi:hypothetical protein